MKQINKRIAGLFLLLFSHNVFAVQLNLCDEYFDENIHSVEMLKNGKYFELPLINQQKNDKLQLVFDYLYLQDMRELEYKITKCTANWEKTLLAPNQYIDGFINGYLSEQEASQTTGIHYTKYSFTFPNYDFSFLETGNYVISIFEDEERRKLLLRKRFYVSGNKAKIQARISQVNDVKKSLFYQQVNLSIDISNTKTRAIGNNIAVVIRQNGRWDNAIVLEKPDYTDGNMLYYESISGRVFEGGNEYFKLNLVEKNTWSSDVQGIKNIDGVFHLFLKPKVVYSSSSYSFSKDINGKKAITRNDTKKSQLEYFNVTFSLIPSGEVKSGEIFILGDVLNWKLDKNSRLNYNPKTKNYEKNIFLKQGYYDFLYCFRPYGNKKCTLKGISGSSYEAENQYHVFVYEKQLSPPKHNLIGYSLFSSLSK